MSLENSLEPDFASYHLGVFFTRSFSVHLEMESKIAEPSNYSLLC